MFTLGKREKSFCIAGLIVSLLLGLFVYVTSGTHTYISDIVSLPTIHYPTTIVYYLCDFLWAFALCCGLRLLGNSMKNCLWISLALSVSLEIMQIWSSIGTFDIFDILVEVSAIIIFMVVINLLITKGKKKK